MFFSVFSRRYVLLALLFLALTVLLFLSTDRPQTLLHEQLDRLTSQPKQQPNPGSTPAKTKEKEKGKEKKPQPQYLPEPKWTAPPVVDPFPSLATSDPPAIPEWNMPAKDLHKHYGIGSPPPLFIGFTRGWPILIQAVVSYITAGWPPEQIYVIENTGTQWANARGKLTLQNPFYLNHESLRKLRVNIVQTPVLLNFAQLQNFYIYLAHEHGWPQYFWSHMDVLVSSWEAGRNGGPQAGEAGYRSLYENCLAELNATLGSSDHWATRFFAYDHLTLVNREAYDDVGGWDTYIPYYITDCDMHSRLLMHNWTLDNRMVGIISDVATVLKDLRVLYRDPQAELGYTDPNPPPPPPVKEGRSRGEALEVRDADADAEAGNKQESDNVQYWRRLRKVVDEMEKNKRGKRGRNTWQGAQRGGEGEPYYYPARGVQKAFDMLTAVGGKIYDEKWGHRGCELIKQGKLKLEDQWRVAHDWE